MVLNGGWLWEAIDALHTSGSQTSQNRGLVVVETAARSVAVLAMGMSQVSSGDINNRGGG